MFKSLKGQLPVVRVRFSFHFLMIYSYFNSYFYTEVDIFLSSYLYYK